MCSIAGIIGGALAPERRHAAAEAMNKALRHRGPDQTGIFDADRVSLAHNRLSVIDPANGLQPMTRSRWGCDYTIIYNGELYNTAQLRRELEGMGFLFSTNCDTEVLLASYMAWGAACLEQLNGIFAFAIYDARLQRVFLARDRMGVKPLFYAKHDGDFVFASEIKALFCYPGFTPRLDREGLWQLVYLLPTRIPGSGVFRDVHELLPGWCMEVQCDGTVYSRPYWQLQAREHRDSPEDTVRQVGELVRDAITRQLVSDVPLCTLLSGGLDSSIISSVAARHLHAQGKELDTYSFEHEGNREHFRATPFQPNSDDAYASAVAEYIGSRHTILTASSEDEAALLRDAAAFRDMPGMGDVDASLLYYCSLIKRRHTVGLSGECADEIFGGYPWFANPPQELTGFPWIHSLGMRSSLFNAGIIRPKDGEAYIDGVFRRSLAECPVLDGESDRDRVLRQISHASIMWFMHSLLERKDRMSMASALEVRVPFADHRIAEYVFNIPWDIKRRDNVEKAVLRDASEDLLPESVLHRKKSPYPKTHDPLYEQLVTAQLKQVLEDPSSALHTLLRKDILVDIGNLQNLTWFGQLMARPQLVAYLVQLDHWFRHYNVGMEF